MVAPTGAGSTTDYDTLQLPDHESEAKLLGIFCLDPAHVVHLIVLGSTAC